MDVYSIVTNRIIEQLEKGCIPWKKPWANCLSGTFNRITRKPYSLLNRLLLIHDGEYATYKQWHDVGGSVRKGEKAEIVVFWKLQDIQERDESGEIKIRKVPLLRYYSVFHISQVENVLPLKRTEHYQTRPIECAEKTLNDYVRREGIYLKTGESAQAFYRPSDDSITLPSITQFEMSEDYYATAFHECSHSTMKACRCNREAENKSFIFGSENYSKEELVAEISSAAILHTLGIETRETFRNSCAYIQNWLQALRNDRRFIVSAAGKAEKAANYILKDHC